MANQQKTPRRGGGWPFGATVAASNIPPSYTGLYGGIDSMLGQNGYAGGNGSLSSAQFGDGGGAQTAMGDSGGAGGSSAGGGTGI